MAIDVVARETGFADPERMRRAFLRAFGQPPQAIKRAARERAALASAAHDGSALGQAAPVLDRFGHVLRPARVSASARSAIVRATFSTRW